MRPKKYIWSIKEMSSSSSRGYFYNCVFSGVLYLNIFIKYGSILEPLPLCKISSPLMAHLWHVHITLRWTGVVWQSNPVHPGESVPIHIAQISIYRCTHCSGTFWFLVRSGSKLISSKYNQAFSFSCAKLYRKV